MCLVVFNAFQSLALRSTSLICSWNLPGKNTEVGCHFLLQCMKMKNESDVAQSCPTLNNPMDCSPPGSSVHGIFQARILEWGAITKSRTRLCDFTFTFFHALEKEISTHSSVPAWRIPGTEEPGGLLSMGVAQSRTRLK